MKKGRLKEKITLDPIMTLLILIAITIVISGFLSLLGVQVNYNTIANDVTLEYTQGLASVSSLFSLSGLKYIFSTTVSNFVAFTPLSSLIIILIGIGVMEKSGFLKTTITLLTKKAKKNTVTFVIVLTCLLSSIIGNLPYVIMIPLSAIIFTYGKRNPYIGIIASYAALTAGTGINVLFTSVDSALLTNTLLGSHIISPNYALTSIAFVFIMTAAVIILSVAITAITENYIAPRLPKYEFPANAMEDDFTITNKELKGLIFAVGAGLLYLLFFIYCILPINLPLAGAFLDNRQVFYIDKLFSADSFFSNGFVFIVTMAFIILGFFYGIGAKTIKNNKDLCDDLGHSIDEIGKIIVLIFIASIFISVFKKTNIGEVITAGLANILTINSLGTLPLIIILFIISAISTLFLPNSTFKWGILAGIAVPTLMDAGIAPEFTQVIFRFGECVTMGLTPLMAYYVIYLAYLDRYNQDEKPINLFKTLKYQLPYSITVGIILLALIIIWFIIGLPIGINGVVNI
ncbi:MAG: AbgT family transporter [Bacilli bacterium]|nr:AbgT family transporter [Bacilli bacterium]